ncbi:MAG: glycosyl hydrolase family 28-related protein, partial [Kiritimatiellia bacterium]
MILKTANVLKFGAIGDGLADDSPAIQKALDSGARRVKIPSGKYRIVTTLRVNSHTEILADKDAVLFLCGNTPKKRGDFLLTNANHQEGNEKIRIRGGIWDGNNQGPCNTKTENLFDPNAWSGSVLNFYKVDGLTLRDITVANSVTYNIRLCRINHFDFRDIRFQSDRIAFNQDGLHFGGYCRNGRVRNVAAISKGQTNDDLIALNADDSLVRLENLDLECGPIENISFENISAEDCHTGVRFLSVDSPIRHIRIRNFQAGCRCYAINADGARYCRTPLFSDIDRPEGVGCIEDVVLDGFSCHATLPQTSTLLALETNPRKSGLVIRNFSRDMEKDQAPNAPTLLLRKIGKACLTLGSNRKTIASVEVGSDSTGAD